MKRLQPRQKLHLLLLKLRLPRLLNLLQLPRLHLQVTEWLLVLLLEWLQKIVELTCLMSQVQVLAVVFSSKM